MDSEVGMLLVDFGEDGGAQVEVCLWLHDLLIRDFGPDILGELGGAHEGKAVRVIT